MGYIVPNQYIYPLRALCVSKLSTVAVCVVLAEGLVGPLEFIVSEGKSCEQSVGTLSRMFCALLLQASYFTAFGLDIGF